MLESLTAEFANSDSITYKNPVSWTCLEFSGCPNWQSTETVSWNPPSNKYGILYTSDKCIAEGQFHYISNRKETTDRIQLRKARKFRSMMVAEYVVARPSLKYLTKCSASTKEHGVIGGTTSYADEMTGNATNSSESSTNYGSVEGSNWYNVLPMSENSGSFFYDDEVVDADTFVVFEFFEHAGCLAVLEPRHFDLLDVQCCDHWEAASSISWANIPASKFAMFFETDTCHAGDKYSFISDQAHPSGTHEFQSAQPIRSMMIGTDANYTRRPSFIYFQCPPIEAANVTSDRSVSEDALSSNWSDAL